MVYLPAERACACVFVCVVGQDKWDQAFCQRKKKKREVKENRREKETEECCILDFVVFLVDVAVCK